jgi:hypothetical protein
VSDKHGSARRRAIIGLITVTLIITGGLVAIEVGATSPLPIAIGVIGWMSAAMAGWAWMVKALLKVCQTLTRMGQDLTALSDDAREHREKLNAELKQAVADGRDDLKLHAIMWLMERQGQVQSMEREARAMEKALGIADRLPADELAERRAAR